MIDQARIIEPGTHDELMSGETMYRGLYEKQFVIETGTPSG